MGCEQCRELLSARLDGEQTPAERAATDRHLADCAGCTRWCTEAAAVTRLARTGVVAPAFQVDDAVLDALPTPGGGRRTLGLRIAVGVLGIAQFLLGAAQIGGIADGHLHVVDAVGGSAPNHLWHESAAWNVALGAGFAWIALRRTRPGGILPTLTAFIATLTLLSLNDLIVGRVDTGRILSHGFVAAGYLMLLALDRLPDDPDRPFNDRREPRWTWRARFDEEPAPRPTRLRLVRAATVTVRRRRDAA